MTWFTIGLLTGLIAALVLVAGLIWIDGHTTWLKRMWGE